MAGPTNASKQQQHITACLPHSGSSSVSIHSCKAESNSFLYPRIQNLVSGFNSKCIFAVHGLNPKSKDKADHAWDTWRTPSGPNGHLWLRDDLPKYLPDARIFLYEYDATAVYGSDRDTFIGKASELLEAIRIKREDASRPIILLGHSMGGLFIKQALVNAHNNPKYYPIRDATTGLAFFATPHNGGNPTLVSLGDKAASIAKLLGFKKGDNVLKTLQTDSTFALILEEHWRQQLLKYDIISFWGALDSIVPRESSRLGLPGDRENIVKLEADHGGVCKFGTTQTDQDNFELVRSNLNDIYQNALKIGLKPPLTDAERALLEGLPVQDIGSFLDFREEPHSHSCDWLLQHKTFGRFVSSADSHVLHIVGEPGSGKSTMAAWLYHTSHTWYPGVEPLIFSFHDKHHSSAAWSSLLHQLFHLGHISASAFHTALEGENQSSRWRSEHSSSNIWTPTRLRAVLKAVVTGLPSVCRTIFIIDALDECKEKISEVLKPLVDILQSSANPRTKFLLLGRETAVSQIDNQFNSAGGVCRIILNEDDDHIKSVQSFVETKVDDLCKERSGFSFLRSEIVEELGCRSAGIYLLASLNLESLETAEATSDNIRSVIRTLPDNLQAIYSQTLDKVATARRTRVSALLLWVLFSVRPLRHRELSAAVAVTYQDMSSISQSTLEAQVSVDLLGETGIRELVGSLLRVTRGGIVSFVHSSAKEYLLSISRVDHTHSWVWSCVENIDHAGNHPILAVGAQAMSLQSMALIAFAHRVAMSTLPPDTDPPDTPNTSVRLLLHYAIENLPDHVRQSPSRDETHTAFANFLSSNGGKTWMRQFWSLKDPGQKYRDLSPVEFCCTLGIVETVKQLLPLDQYPRGVLSDVKAVKSAKADAVPLLAAVDLAAMFGNVEILRLLCEDMGTPATSTDLIPGISWKPTPSGYVHIGQNLGHYDVPIPARGTRGEDVAHEAQAAKQQLSWYRPLHTATAYGHADAAEYLISRGASIELEDQRDQWPIEIAIESHITGLASLLLRQHLEWNTLGLIQRFIDVGKTKNLDYLLEARPKFRSDGLDLKTDIGQHKASISHIAAARGNLTVYDYLTGAEVRATLVDSDGRKSVHYAAASAQHKMLESMLSRDNNVATAEDSMGRNLLFYTILGASCCAAYDWSSVAARERVIQLLRINVDASTFLSMFKSALHVLARLSVGSNVSYRLQSDDYPGPEGVAFRSCLEKLISQMGVFKMDDSFLHEAFASAFFPLDIALSLSHDANELDSDGRTALHIAASAEKRWCNWHEKLAELIADVNHQDVKGMTALRLAVDCATSGKVPSYNIFSRFQVLINHGASSEYADNLGITPVAAAAQFLMTQTGPVTRSIYLGSVGDGFLNWLLSGNPKVAESINDEILPPLVSALATSERSKDLKALVEAMSERQRNLWLDHGLPTLPVTIEVLFTCHEAGWPLETLSPLLSRFNQGQLQQAFQQIFRGRSIEILDLLKPLLAGLDGALLPDRQELMTFAQQGKKDAIECYLEMGGDVNAIDGVNQTLLSHAAENGRSNVTSLLLSRGANPSIEDERGRSAVYWAARENKLDVLKLLIDAGAPINKKDIGVATMMQRKEVQFYLMERFNAKKNIATMTYETEPTQPKAGQETVTLWKGLGDSLSKWIGKT